MEKGLTKQKYKQYLKTLSNEKLLEEYDIQNSPFSIAITMDNDYDKAHLTTEEVLRRLNSNGSMKGHYIHITNRDSGEHIFRPDGYSKNRE